MKHRCQYKYKDGAQCTAKVEPGKKMCEAHTLLTQLAKDKAKHNAKNYDRYNENRKIVRAKNQKIKKPKKIVHKIEERRIHDHTAPWRCSLDNCERCKDKPSYNSYMSKYKGVK